MGRSTYGLLKIYKNYLNHNKQLIIMWQKFMCQTGIFIVGSYFKRVLNNVLRCTVLLLFIIFNYDLWYLKTLLKVILNI